MVPMQVLPEATPATAVAPHAVTPSFHVGQEGEMVGVTQQVSGLDSGHAVGDAEVGAMHWQCWAKPPAVELRQCVCVCVCVSAVTSKERSKSRVDCWECVQLL